jgi:Osmosensitive K+ channel histidine kinase
MKYCSKCNLYVNTELDFCPLCASELKLDKDGITSKNDVIGDIYPKPDGVKKYNLLLRILLFLTVVITSTCLLINILTYDGILWSLVVAGAIQLLWAAIAHPLIHKRNIGHLITVDAISICILLVIIQTTTHTQGWGLEYVIPFLFISATTVISFVILIRRMKWREYAMYQFIMIVLGLLPVISVISGMAKTMWPSILSAFYSLLTLSGMFIFADKKYKNELIKRFHF